MTSICPADGEQCSFERPGFLALCAVINMDLMGFMVINSDLTNKIT
jgi:L-asparaginase II